MSTPIAVAPWTPGPWIVDRLGVIAPKRLARGDGHRRIARCDKTTSYENAALDAENEANARLIAESPTMAALLEECIAELSEASKYWMHEDADRVQPLLERARETIDRIRRGK